MLRENNNEEEGNLVKSHANAEQEALEQAVSIANDILVEALQKLRAAEQDAKQNTDDVPRIAALIAATTHYQVALNKAKRLRREIFEWQETTENHSIHAIQEEKTVASHARSKGQKQ